MSVRDTNILHLHPSYRQRSEALLQLVIEKNLPIERYEGWRDPNRQAFLYAEGRVAGVGKPGHHVTYERAWEGNHQYGFAEDWVWWDGGWTWAAPEGHSWDEFFELVAKAGLEHLTFEQPHVQLPGFRGRDILSGVKPWPAGGDDSWEQNIERAIIAWGRSDKVVSGIGMPGAPPLISNRPVISGVG